jgi:hypothetical protein
VEYGRWSYVRSGARLDVEVGVVARVLGVQAPVGVRVVVDAPAAVALVVAEVLAVISRPRDRPISALDRGACA